MLRQIRARLSGLPVGDGFKEQSPKEALSTISRFARVRHPLGEECGDFVVAVFSELLTAALSAKDFVCTLRVTTLRFQAHFRFVLCTATYENADAVPNAC
jgi:hypothetical protein